MSTEIEIKLEVDTDGARLLKSCSLLTSSDPQTRSQVTVYYDTSDQRLRELGWTLRVRSSGTNHVQTLKQESASVGLFSRGEWEWAVASAEPDLQLIRDHADLRTFPVDGLQELKPLVQTDIQRTSWRCRQGSSQVAVDFDVGSVQGRGRAETIHEVELELVSGKASDLFAAAILLAEQVPVRIAVLSKADRGFALVDGKTGGAHKSAPIDMQPTMNVADAFALVVSACVKHYALNEQAVLHQRNSAALHQARVALRRLRSALTLFKSAISDNEFVGIKEDLRWFTAQLGDARNLDVYLQRDLTDAERATACGRREQAYDKVLAAMLSQSFRLLLINLLRWTSLGSWREAKRARAPVQRLAERRLDRLWAGIEQAGPDLVEMDEDSRHQLRIQIKKLRYGMEFFQGLHRKDDKARKRFVAAIERLQEELGKLNDEATARSLAVEADQGWIISPPSTPEHLQAADLQVRKLLRAGPFWRAATA